MPIVTAKPAAEKATPSLAQTRRQAMRDRVQRTIASPKAQKEKSALLERMPGDDDADWEELLSELTEHDNVTIAHRDDGSVQIFWTVTKD
ncbi:hypothetical protein 9F2_46 [uncultured Caudovirales phage]|uniref:DUF1654 domain-containing protein n=1 Tax=uncultured Caudovirales phage TaxID=2100421 RepID=A0A2H4J8G7_9CAUD|nr:hypothetical protein 9F2_46 [uncultured Caudovirales phage]